MGSEFTDRFAVDMPGKPKNKPSGNHPFDRACAKAGIEHRLARPFRPQTNGMVERFNRRIAEAIGREKKRGISDNCILTRKFAPRHSTRPSS